jgi:hypothetical protein
MLPMLAMRSAACSVRGLFVVTGHWHNVCLLLMIHCSIPAHWPLVSRPRTSDRQLFVPKAPSLHALLAPGYAHTSIVMPGLNDAVHTIAYDQNVLHRLPSLEQRAC